MPPLASSLSLFYLLSFPWKPKTLCLPLSAMPSLLPQACLVGFPQAPRKPCLGFLPLSSDFPAASSPEALRAGGGDPANPYLSVSPVSRSWGPCDWSAFSPGRSAACWPERPR